MCPPRAIACVRPLQLFCFLCLVTGQTRQLPAPCGGTSRPTGPRKLTPSDRDTTARTVPFGTRAAIFYFTLKCTLELASPCRGCNLGDHTTHIVSDPHSLRHPVLSAPTASPLEVWPAAAYAVKHVQRVTRVRPSDTAPVKSARGNETQSTALNLADALPDHRLTLLWEQDLTVFTWRRVLSIGWASGAQKIVYIIKLMMAALCDSDVSAALL